MGHRAISKTMSLPEPSLSLKVDSEALAVNWQALDRLSGAAEAGAAVKANAYGLGIDRVVPTLSKAGARTFYVAHWSEVASVLKHVPPNQLSVLHGVRNAGEVAYARETGVRPVLNSLDQARLWHESGGELCDVMVDTGINRLGLPMECVGDPIIDQLEIDTVMSHLACADEDSPFNRVQLDRSLLAFATIKARRRSIANSAGIALGGDFALDLTRPGLSIYGGVPRPELEGTIRQVAHLQASILQVRYLSAGDSVGYNAIFTASSDMRVGVVSLGYADGFLRCWGGKAALQHEGRDLPLLGRVSMDMIVVDLGNAPNAVEGGWLDVPYSLPEASRLAGLSQYELLTILGPRLS
jgi:alanine racemase